MVTVTVCVGSSCHLKGAREVIEQFNTLVTQYELANQVALKGCFCMERCGEGINWQVNQEYISSLNGKEAVETFFRKVLEPLRLRPADGPQETT